VSDAKRELLAWRASGQTQVAFASERGYSDRRLWQWSGRLRARGWDPGTAAGEQAVLVPVRVVDTEPAVAMGAPAGAPIEVELRNGVLVRVQSDFDGKALQRVVDVVGRC
jgi:hypothetical protein